MDLKQSISVKEIAELLNATIIGDNAVVVSSVNEIHKVKKGSLTFVDHPKYFNQAIYSSASVIIVNAKVDCPENKALLLVDEPFEAYNFLAKRFLLQEHSTDAVSKTAVVGTGTILESGVVLGNHVTIGENCLIRANVVIGDYTTIGDNTIIHPNTAIGNDAFYFKRNSDKRYQKWHTIGRVVIESDVEIGACCTIDRGVSGDTIIGAGTKIDNQVHIAHGVELGKNCLIAAQAGIAGKTIIQNDVIIYGQAGISKSLVVGEGAVILAQTGVSKSIPGGKQYFGSPAGEALTKFKELAALRRLPSMLNNTKVDKLSKDAGN